jgi:XTP/dITP diphosphohydrolase
MSDEKASPKAEIQGPKLGVTRPDSEDQFIDVGLRISDTGLRTLFLASSNPGKLREFRAAAAARGITVEELPSFANITPCIENGSTFAENARKKAIHYSRNCPGWVFADDSGICVDALDGAPGVYSARFAGSQATDAQNNQQLLAEIHRVEMQRSARAATVPPMRAPFNRAAHYVCVIALAEAGHVLSVVEGRADGVIIDEPRGAGGFGYDPYFLHLSLGKTFAEMLPEEKFAVSHRGAAFRHLLDYLCPLEPPRQRPPSL